MATNLTSEDKENYTGFSPPPRKRKRSHGHGCAYFNCSNEFYTPEGERSPYHFFHVPMNAPEKSLWCNRMGKVDGKDGFKVTKNTKVCNLHFKPGDVLKVPGGKRWRLKNGAVPKKYGKPVSPLKRKPPAIRQQKMRPKKLNFEDLIIPKTMFQPKSLVELCTMALKTLHEKILTEYRKLESELEKTRTVLETAKTNLCQKTFGINVVQNNDNLCKHYTGFPNYEKMKICLDFLQPGTNGENIVMKHSKGAQPGIGRPRALSTHNQFFITLLKLRRGFSNIHLAWLFNCDESTVSRTFCAWINFMFLQFLTIPIWPSREQIDACMPQSFKQSFPKTRVILDCTEVFVEAPESLHLRSQFYSDYKHHNTYKALIGITPSGSLSFISELFPGSVSDREIVQRSGILNPKFWDYDDEVMADKGFEIRDMLGQIGVGLNIPIFLGDKQQFSMDEVIINQKVASQRIHVERYINRVKNFAIFDKPIPISMHGSANQIFTSCSYLVMFQGPIISL